MHAVREGTGFATASCSSTSDEQASVTYDDLHRWCMQSDLEKAVTERLAKDAAKSGLSVPGQIDSVPGASATLK